MGNPLLNIKPHQVSRDLRGYSVLFYGSPKTGKTTIASKFPDSLLLAFEKGFNALPGVMAAPINSWGEFKKTLIDLNDKEVKKMYSTIIIDTADIAYAYCEKYISSNNQVNNVKDIPYGAAYKMCENEFDECIREILKMDYGLVIISHSQEKTFINKDGVEHVKIVPTLDKRASKICTRTCDIIGFSTPVDTEQGTVTKLFLRDTPRYTAGSRFKYMPDVIDFTYDNLVKALSDAIEKEAQENGGKLVTENRIEQIHAEEEFDFTQLMEDFNSLTSQLVEKDPSNAIKITAVIDKILGVGKKVMDCTPGQAEQINIINYNLTQLL